jgi:diadenosine tetraphosphate (Ap4A) HIT family hydrolase
MTAWESVDALGAERTIREHGREEPLVFPREAWSARTFLNVAPITRDPGSGANGFVIAVNPDHEDADLATSPGNLWNALPGEVVEAVVWSWALLESWADRRALLSVPFINGGKDSASGQSLAAFHAQFYAVDPRSAPFLSGRSRETADGVDCPVCALNDTPDLLVARIGSTDVFVHPAPEIEHTLLVAPLDHVSGLGDLSHLADFAEGLRVAVGDLRFIGGRVPPYNVAVRAGRYVDHLHAEVIPRSGVPAAGGFEKATGLFVATREPAAVAAAIRDRFGEDPGGAGPEDAG